MQMITLRQALACRNFAGKIDGKRHAARNANARAMNRDLKRARFARWVFASSWVNMPETGISPTPKVRLQARGSRCAAKRTFPGYDVVTAARAPIKAGMYNEL